MAKIVSSVRPIDVASTDSDSAADTHSSRTATVFGALLVFLLLAGAVFLVYSASSV
jgi:hypothetical protein